MNKHQPTEEEIMNKLKECLDPEIPINLVDLGLIYKISIKDDLVEVIMTLTTPGCGMGGYIASNVREKLLTIDGVHEASVNIVWEPPWNASMMSQDARHKLGYD